MGTISIKKLGGLSLIVGPVLALICYFLQPGGMLIDAADPADAAASIAAIMANTELAHITGLLIPLGLIMLFFGIMSLQETFRGGNGEAITRYSVVMGFIAVIAWVLGSAVGHVIASGAGLTAAGGTLYALMLGLSNMGSAVFSLAILTLSLGISTREGANKMAAMAIAALSVVLLGTSLIGAMDSSQLQTMTMIGGLCFIAFTVWTITLGLGMLKKE
jgi:hypothetical protein